ncbi:MAG: hypothetical protein HZC41_18730 [Chloroflexi bacterium]|nr:hypothetical protein [Chloroflexota bacterium]
MTLNWTGVLGLLGPLSIVVALVVLALLSRRLGSVTRMPRYYLGLFLSAGLMLVSIVARLVSLGRPATTGLHHDPLVVFLYVGLPAIALTIAIVVAWRYWSWLLAERG